MGKRILMISNCDFAGSGYRIVEAVNLNTNHFVEYAVLKPVSIPKGIKRGPALLSCPKEGGHYQIFEETIERMQSIVNDVDIVHFKGDDLPFREFIPHVVIPDKTKVIVTVGGTYFRRGNSPVAEPQHKISEYKEVTDLRTALTPDLNYPEFGGIYTQHSYDSRKIKAVEVNNARPIISHSPSSTGKKGTALFRKAIEILAGKGYDFDFDIIQNVSYDECIKRKGASDIFFDQVNEVGFYGNSAIEAMAMGIPVVTYLSDEALNQADGALKDCPVINSGNTPESIAEALEYVLNSDIKKLAKETKEWCDSFHSYETTGKMWGKIYENLY